MILEKHVCQREKFEEMKMLIEQKNTKIRDECVKDMIQKERAKVCVFKIQKNPTSKYSKKLIRDLNIDLSIQQSRSILMKRRKLKKNSESESPHDCNY